MLAAGNADYDASTFAALAQTVHKATTKTAMGSSRNPSRSGQSVTFPATVSTAFGGDPTGPMTFKDGSVTGAQPTLCQSGGESGGLSRPEADGPRTAGDFSLRDRARDQP